MSSRKLPWTLGIGLLLIVLTLVLASLLASVRSRVAAHLPVIGPVAGFALTNQANTPVSLEALRGKVWVADIIFTPCAGPCPRMTQQMKELQDALPRGEARLVTLTTFPEYDTPEVLDKYARDHGADTNRWMFLTGDKKEIGALAIDSLKLAAVEVKPEQRTSANDLFIHSTMFVVVDKQARLRGVFETGGEGVDWQAQKRKILAAVKQLEREK